LLTTYILRAILIGLIPFALNLWTIYVILVFLSVAKAFFGPASMTYVTMMIPIEQRKRFNSIRSFSTSSAFIIGPAFAGALAVLTNLDVTLWINAVFFLLAAALLYVLPEKEVIEPGSAPPLTVSQVAKDFTVVSQFMRDNKYVSAIYLGFIAIMLFSYAMDTQEVVFTQQVIGLSELDYGLLISITGIGSVAGALLLSIIANRISIQQMIAVGLILTTAGYVVYAFSWSFLSITVGFVILGFFNVFLNAGILTFYQNNVPVSVMGRVTSIFQLIQSVFQVVFILMIGLLADIVSLRLTIVALALIMLATAFVYILAVLNPRYSGWYQEELKEELAK
ncbi:MAG TPA: MFS transporter, partial [Planococcus sp. (in: firmicutes)]|nr:MFS transporter [Planococcus sp. (in: firmicutes)]